MLSNIYSKSYLQTSEPLRLITQRLITERFIPQLEFIAGSQTPVNFIPLFCAATMDFITAYQFGLARCADFLRDGEACTRFLGLYYGGRRAYDFWQQEMSGFTNALRALGIKVVPKHVRAANAEIEAGALQMCSSALDYLADLSLRRQSTGGEGGARAEDSPVVLAQLDGALLKHGALPKHGALLKHPSRAEQEQAEDGRRRRLVVASELLDHSAAGFETSAITLTYAVHELSRRPRLQDQLRAELYTLRPRIRAGGSGSALAPPDPACALPSAKDVDGLPLLHAVVLETLRRHPSIPGSQPRVVPKGGCLLDGEAAIWIPEGVRISAQPYSLHKDPSLFPRPLDWAPQRWLTPDRRHLRTDHTAKEMNRGFWAFSSGARMCVGSHFAMHGQSLLFFTLTAVSRLPWH